MGSPPVLRLDFSDQNKANLAILQCQVEELTIQLIDKEKYLQMNEETIKQLTEEVEIF